MRFKDPSVEQIRVGSNRIGIAGLSRALKKATESDLSGREAIVDFLVKTLASENYLQPVVSFSPPTDEGEHPQIVINGQAIVQGRTTREDLKTALHKSISGW